MLVAEAACRKVAVVGLGRTGRSVVRFLHTQDKEIYAYDDSLEAIARMRKSESMAAYCERIDLLDESELAQMDLIVVRPGVNLQRPVFLQLRQQGVPMCGDVELFCQFNQVPVIAITGSNGKTTVTTLMLQALRLAGKKVEAAGNIGAPVLDLLGRTDLDDLVLELSSFQLQSTCHLRSAAAVVLNCTPDHLDQHASYAEYCEIKQRIYQGAQVAVVNADQPELGVPREHRSITFALSAAADFTVVSDADFLCVTFCGERVGMASNWCLQGAHHVQNGLALLALMQALALPLAPAFQLLQQFSGLEHRCQKIAEHAGVIWYNDSKATNEGACVAALQTLRTQVAGRIILLAGGDAKGADFLQLPDVVAQCVATAIVFGQDGPLLKKLFERVTKVYTVETMSAAICLASRIALSGDAVVLSPACASYDMFDDYTHRGREFIQLVKKEIMCQDQP